MFLPKKNIVVCLAQIPSYYTLTDKNYTKKNHKDSSYCNRLLSSGSARYTKKKKFYSSKLIT